MAHPRAAVEAAAKSGRLEIPELRRFPSLGLFLFTPLARSVAGTISAPIRIARTTAARPPSVIADCGDFEHPGSPGRGARLWTYSFTSLKRLRLACARPSTPSLDARSMQRYFASIEYFASAETIAFDEQQTLGFISRKGGGMSRVGEYLAWSSGRS